MWAQRRAPGHTSQIAPRRLPEQPPGSVRHGACCSGWDCCSRGRLEAGGRRRLRRCRRRGCAGLDDLAHGLGLVSDLELLGRLRRGELVRLDLLVDLQGGAVPLRPGDEHQVNADKVTDLQPPAELVLRLVEGQPVLGGAVRVVLVMGLHVLGDDAAGGHRGPGALLTGDGLHDGGAAGDQDGHRVLPELLALVLALTPVQVGVSDLRVVVDDHALNPRADLLMLEHVEPWTPGAFGLELVVIFVDGLLACDRGAGGAWAVERHFGSPRVWRAGRTHTYDHDTSATVNACGSRCSAHGCRTW